ncbi:MAG TPA: undecaprenyl-phosphate glucose phosphotransferase [Kaistia sp.]|nr:undecaprenyl-phosphate glucose phosphotransferase [Kaistia sp.]
MAADTEGRFGEPGRPALGEEALAVASALSKRSLAPAILANAVQAFEFSALLIIGAVLRHLVGSGLGSAGWLGWTAIVMAPLLTVMAAHSDGSYLIAALRDGVGALGRLLAVWTGVILLLAALAFLLDLGSSGAPRWLLLTYVSGLALLLAERSILAHLVARWMRQGRFDRRAVIVGGGDEAEALIATLADESPDIRVCGVFDDRGSERSPERREGPPKLGTVAELVTFARIAEIDLLIVSLPQSAEGRVLEILRALWVLPVDIRLSALGARLRFRPRAYSFIGSIPFLDLADRPISGWSAVAKRSFDLSVAVLALILLSPVMLATALAVRLDSPGPILFRQKRYGFNNEVISVLKFRSMYHHLSDPAAKVVVSRGDPRVTRVGRFIRRTSIDELPQLFNVLAGTLSIVGPRPHAVNAHTAQRLWDEVVDGYFARHRVKPGITGWAQINGWRGEIDSPEKIQRRVEFDLEYIERWSVLFDLYIVAMTPLRLLQGENAY